MCRAFYDAYELKHRYRDDGAQVEAVDWALVAMLPQPAIDRWRFAAAEEKRNGRRRAWFPEAGGYVEVPTLSRAAIAAVGSLVGPAIVEDPDSSTVILPGDIARVDSRKHLVIDISQESR